MSLDSTKPMYCPRCDKLKPNLEVLKDHVSKQHPDYDPEWWDTYPTAIVVEKKS